MNILDILFIGLGLSMDAFAVSVCKGLAMKKMHLYVDFILEYFRL